MTAQSTPPLRALPYTYVAALLFGTFYLFCRLPFPPDQILFYDDGETLYELANLMKGGTPYLDTRTHHFAGYVLPLLPFYLIFGWTPFVLIGASFAAHILLGVGVYKIAALRLPHLIATLLGLSVVLAREPYVLGLSPVFLLTVGMVWCFYGFQRVYTHPTKGGALALGLLTGFCVIMDQRGLALLLPLAILAWVKRKEGILTSLVVSALVFPVAGLLFLASRGAANAMIFQTLVYPFAYRSSGESVWSSLQTLIGLHRPLLTETPYLLILGALGILFSWRSLFSLSSAASLPLILCAAAIPLLGGREHSYYTWSWIPVLALLSSGLYEQGMKNQVKKSLFAISLFAAIVTPLFGTAALLSSLPVNHDPVPDVASALQRLDPNAERSLYVWGYRPDLYTYTQRLSLLPWVNRQMIHPDSGVTDPLIREKRVDRSELEHFAERLITTPPDFLITVDPQAPLPSLADNLVQQVTKDHYRKLLQAEGTDFVGINQAVTVWERKKKP